jgi:hypothetical protein
MSSLQKFHRRTNVIASGGGGSPSQPSVVVMQL